MALPEKEHKDSWKWWNREKKFWTSFLWKERKEIFSRVNYISIICINLFDSMDFKLSKEREEHRWFFFLLKFENSSPRYTVRVFETSRFLKSCIKLIQLSKFICFNPKILSNLKFNPQVFKLRKPLYNSAFKELNLEASKAWFDVKNFKKKKNKNRAFFI